MQVFPLYMPSKAQGATEKVSPKLNQYSLLSFNSIYGFDAIFLRLHPLSFPKGPHHHTSITFASSLTTYPSHMLTMAVLTHWSLSNISPYKDQNEKTGPIWSLIWNFGPYSLKIEVRAANLLKNFIKSSQSCMMYTYLLFGLWNLCSILI